MLRVDPSCALIRNAEGYCPLHTAAQIGNFAAVQLLCAMVPASAEVQCEEGCIPLHEALTIGSDHQDAPQIISTLINTFPSSIKLTNDEGLLPIHLAAMSGSSCGIRIILGFGLSTIFARENTEETLPLDFAVDGLMSALRNKTQELYWQTDSYRKCTTILLMSAFYKQPILFPEDSLDTPFLPIHGTATAQPCKRSWTQLMSLYGEEYGGALDQNRKTALHILMSSALFQEDLVADAVSSIHSMHPHCITHLDNTGFIPLHAALINKMPYNVVQRLVECNGSSVSASVSEDCANDSFRAMFPFQLAASCGCDLDVINFLLRSAPDLITHHERMPRFLLKAKLKPEKEQQYVDEHNNIYPEVSSGLRSAGVINLHIWKDGLSLYLMVEMEEGKDLSALGEGSDYRNSCPRIQEWEVKMETEFHGGWTQIEEIHSSDNW
ncbi:hypothetical protein HJC23_012722 [Cyclotella cryptica]|uniref:Uncharacterized protein n=1 Tax=Cyclotella cryptica TaxID=29204 RepID=A0ABD3NZ88_9STRA